MFSKNTAEKYMIHMCMEMEQQVGCRLVLMMAYFNLSEDNDYFYSVTEHTLGLKELSKSEITMGKNMLR